jgi:hypothetical protein
MLRNPLPSCGQLYMGGLVLGGLVLHSFVYYCRLTQPGVLRAFSLDSPWLGKCCVLFLLDLYIYFGFPLARLKWSSLLKLVRLPLHSLQGLHQQIDNPMDHKCALAWVKTCIIIHTHISFIEHANKDREFIGGLIHKGANTSPNSVRPDSDGPSDILQDTLSQCKYMQLKDLLFKSLDKYNMIMR